MKDKYIIFDSHAHYDDKAFDEDREVLLKELINEGVVGVLNCASSYESISKTINIINNWSFIYGALGIHPEYANELNEDVINEIRKELRINKKILAIGEIGLDYYWEENPSKDIQKKAFREQMKLAEEFGLPVVIHDREAHGDVIEIIKEFPNVTGVVHCFSGSVEFAKECIKEGYYIGMTGVVTFKNAKKIAKVVEEIPIDKLLVETDCPYMSPEPNRGKRNQSNYIEYILNKIAEIKGLDSLELNKVVNNNFYKLMKLNKLEK